VGSARDKWLGTKIIMVAFSKTAPGRGKIFGKGQGYGKGSGRGIWDGPGPLNRL